MTSGATGAGARHSRMRHAFGRASLAASGVLAMVVSLAPAATAAPTAQASSGQVVVLELPESMLDCSTDPPSLTTTGDPWPRASGFVQDIGWVDGSTLTVAYGIADGAALGGKLAIFFPGPGWVKIDDADGSIAMKVLTCDDPTGQNSADALSGAAPALPRNVSRIAGANRYETAAKIATAFGTARAVVVANGTTAKAGVDALAANYLAGRVGAPIVLTPAALPDTATRNAVRTVLTGATNPVIYVMGGTDSVSDVAAGFLKAAAGSVASGAVTVKRVAGANRYATAALAATTPGAVANSLALTNGGIRAVTAILASGEVNADALAAGPLSYGWGIPVLLTPPDRLPAAAAAAIKSLGITQLIVLGGPDRVSQTVLIQARAAGVARTTRVEGYGRYATAAMLYDFAVGTLQNLAGSHYGAGGTTTYIANGTTGFPDALAVGPLAGKNGDIVLTAQQTALSPDGRSFLLAHREFGMIIGLGSSTGSVSDAVLAAAAASVG